MSKDLQMSEKVLEPGNYIIPKGFTIVRRGEKLQVRKLLKTVVVEDRCRNCKHLQLGRSSMNSRWETTVCMKRSKDNMVNRFTEKPIYCHKTPLDKICEQFERKGTSNE